MNAVKRRQLIIAALVAAAGAVITEHVLKPELKRKFKVR